MRLIAKRLVSPLRQLSSAEYQQASRGQSDFTEVIARGEPYFTDSLRPLVFALGRGTHWRYSDVGCEVFGEGVDPDTVEMFEDVLMARREGHVYGMWYSAFIPEGESGFMHHRHLKEISSREFLRALQALKATE